MTGAPTAAAAATLYWLWGGAGSLGGLGAAILPVTLRVPSTSGQSEGRYGNLPGHALPVTALRTIVAVWRGNGFKPFLGLPAGFASVFVKRHVFLVVKRAFGPNLEVYRGPWMPALDRFLLEPKAFWEAFPERPQRLCFTNGCFDLIHPGHVQYLEEVRALGDFLVVGLNSDASVRRLKGPSRPLQDEWSRARILLGLRSVDAVVRFEEDTPFELIQALAPDVLAKGGDYTPGTVVGRDLVEARGGRLVILPFLPGHSTSLIEARIRSGHGVRVG